ncbi:MAG: aldolase/citrate lyase family protein [SAR202 cluster bacterium]|jgi:4-hydroxy-2-oxoheptanedioate aldolase|nr:aldolase/citrate lyase family protein [SAR202 cluster bacterium]MDP6299781.1 aldolase/citrate lyase family protein [SAR202 cluster bacterium]MDP7102327.1 aldolase/citrate lyase family protein [SAR202 cluster bacterium]MDP7225479.1 aldolase/citrate lyase family protein [SAR202 cluster bacterium]MDP7414151.1 aldolase/citrate lyase family protein [SAR202 cluster bacterium]
MADPATLKERIIRGDRVIGVSAPLTATKSEIEDILGRDTYDFLSSYAQHSPYNEERLVEFCGIADELGMPVQFRIKHTRHTYLTGNIADLGPLGLEVPLVEEEAEADEAIKWFYYPQFGHRSMGGSFRYGVGDMDRLEYARWWNDHGILCLQLESLKAVTNAKQLAKRGVTCFTWGPSDLTFDIEAHPRHPLKSVDDCVRHVIEQLKGTDVKVNFRNYDPALRDHYAEMGVTVFMERPR